MWQNDKTIIITLSSALPLSQQPNIGDTVVLLDMVIKPLCTLSPATCLKVTFTSTMSFQISAPTNPILPSAVLSTPQRIGECNDIVLDASRTAGKAGRPWKQLLYSATSTNLDFINEINHNISLLQDTSQIFSISRDFLSPGFYTFSLQVQNWMGQTALVQTRVEVVSSRALPVVSIPGSSVVNMFKYQPLSVFASASVPSCGGSAINTRVSISYSWLLFRGVQVLNGIDSISKDKRYFKLPPNTLDPGYYTIQVTVSTPSDSSSSSVSVQVGSSGVSAVIKGSEFRVISFQDNIVLDASASSALDFPQSDYPFTYLNYITFVWTCMQISPSYGATCNITLEKEKNPKLLIKASDIHSEDNDFEDYFFTVSVKNDLSSSSSSTTVRIIDVPELPKVSILAAAGKFNVDQKVILSAVIDAQRPAYAMWTVLDKSLNLTEISLVPTTKKFQKGAGLSYQISIKQNAFVAGISYSLKLAVSYDQKLLDQSPSFSTVSIKINAPPGNGIFTVQPTLGVAFKDKFLFKTSDWSDDPEDYPLLASFSYYTTSALNSVIIKGSDEIWQLETSLGQGLASMDYAVFCTTVCRDALASESTLQVTIKVNEAAASEVAAAASKAIDAALDSNDPEALSAVLGAALSSFNAVNCTVEIDCLSLNRKPCSNTAKTCGSCLDGYLGSAGDANTPCSNIDEVKKIGENCIEDSQCISYLCSKFKCEEQEKSCPADCSGHGLCQKLDLTLRRIDSCTESDPYCEAVCTCDNGFNGKDCSIDNSAFLSIVLMVSNLLLPLLLLLLLLLLL